MMHRLIRNVLSQYQSNLEYIIMSGAAKIFAIGLTYPYQVVRSRLQVSHLLTHALKSGY